MAPLTVTFVVALAFGLASVARGATIYNRFYRSVMDGRVVNGTDAEEYQYPFQVSLQYGHRHFCGGSIIAKDWVLTAAHCFDPAMQLGYLNVHAGTTDIKYVNKTAKGVLKNIKGVAIHKEYMPYNGHYNDIALIKVATPFEWTDTVQPVKLPRLLEDTTEYTPATVIGWGMNYTGSPIMSKLQTVDIEIVSDADCLEAYGGDIHSTNICAGTSEGGKNACIGDSGGPLIANEQQVGIVSWSVIPCAKKGYPVVYTEVSHYVDWIREVTKANSGPYENEEGEEEEEEEEEEEKEKEEDSKPEDKPEDNEAVKPEEKESAKPDEKEA